MTIEELHRLQPFSLAAGNKQKAVLPIYQELTKFHMQNSVHYHRIAECLGFSPFPKSLNEVPFLPVRLFKEYPLCSVPEREITKVVTSSGTTGQVSSKIYLDKRTAANQQKALTKIVGDFIGQKRMPMLVLDCPGVLNDRNSFSTRGAGILGFSIFGRERAYALQDDMTINHEAVSSFLRRHEGERVLLFGFTFIIWKHFLLALEQDGKEGYHLPNAIMIHGGGWKKLLKESVSKQEFKQRFKEVCGLRKMHENYGMAEQTGSIYMECECGHLHVSQYSEIIMRRPEDLRPCSMGEKGIMQVMSLLPSSYPGHSLLTEDEGRILGEDDCPCGRKGKYFEIIGRLKSAELRGCSDTYAAGIK